MHQVLRFPPPLDLDEEEEEEEAEGVEQGDMTVVV